MAGVWRAPVEFTGSPFAQIRPNRTLITVKNLALTCDDKSIYARNQVQLNTGDPKVHSCLEPLALAIYSNSLLVVAALGLHVKPLLALPELRPVMSVESLVTRHGL